MNLIFFFYIQGSWFFVSGRHRTLNVVDNPTVESFCFLLINKALVLKCLLIIYSTIFHLLAHKLLIRFFSVWVLRKQNALLIISYYLMQLDFHFSFSIHSLLTIFLYKLIACRLILS